MYLSADAVLRAIAILSGRVHPFIGITFVSCKMFDLSIGSMDDVSIDKLTLAHMDAHHKIDRRSQYYFQPFKGGSAHWVTDRYPSTGLQTINTQTFGEVFDHPRGKRKWGFKTDYLHLMGDILKNIKYELVVPTDALAVWLYKDADVGDISNFDDLVELFFKEYNITQSEKRHIFSGRSMREEISIDAAFVAEPLTMTSVLDDLPKPPDAEIEGGKTITSLQLKNVGPANELGLDFGQRLTLITGDNGLGKSFLLDLAWWAATGQWADREALPRQGREKTEGEVEYTLSGTSGKLSTFSSRFNRRSHAWDRPVGAMTIEALAVFSRANGSFAVADPVRGKANPNAPSSRNLSADEIWNGRRGIIEGLIRDWVRWQTAADRKTFDQFALVLKRLSPEDLGPLTPGQPIRMPDDPREIPTISHRYATIPVTYASSGVQRVLLMAYLIIWSWQEHNLASRQLERPPLRRMMVIVDELEAHLHPKWQRIVLPALLSVDDLLSSELAIQMIAATHSPMILASMEATFNSSTDLLYHLYDTGATVHLEETAFVKYGDVSGWLTSPLFGLRHARSREAEAAIEAAKSLQLLEDPNAADVLSVSNRLKLYLAGDDKFWPRWIYFVEQHGVVI